MKRVLEPELMTDEEQARAYAMADFEEPHNAFVTHFQRVFKDHDSGSKILDLGCGPGDVSIRFARAFPGCEVHGVDGSAAMLRFGFVLLDRAPEVADRVKLMKGMLPDAKPPLEKYDAVISNSLLHHLADPQILWGSVRRFAKRGAPVFVMDLMRPASDEQAKEMVKQYMSDEPEVLRQDFYNSLRASFEVEEIRQQLVGADLESFSVEASSDRHVIIYGVAP
jgi:ubiquinone/menaquinone biosynthesis C-methylase UbiE